jgi:AmpD protein
MTLFHAERASGLMSGARQLPSLNHDERPAGIAPDLIVVHGISLPPGEFGGPWIDRLFTNALPADVHPYFAQLAGLPVSSHLCIFRGGNVTQYVSFNDRAWHAGRSNYGSRSACNDFSVGIELEGTDVIAYEPEQYRVLAAVIAALCEAYPSLSPERLAGHSDIAPGRKTDPGPAFDWPHARRLIAAACAGERPGEPGSA